MSNSPYFSAPFYRLQLPVFYDARGGLVALEPNSPLPFNIARVYYILPSAGLDTQSVEKKPMSRGFHAHKKLQQLAICVHGSCHFVLDSGNQQREEIVLSSPTEGLYIGPGVWREMHDFSADCVLMVLADQPYQPDDYIHSYDDFLAWMKNKPTLTSPLRPICQTVSGRSMRLRPIRVDEADFVLRLRTSTKSVRNLSPTQADLSAQERWLMAYKERESRGQEHYFVIEGLDGQRFGLVRIYDLTEHSFSWGSWLIEDAAPNACAIESALLVYEYAFGFLRFEQSHFDVRKGNTRVIAFHQRFGAEVVAEDDENLYFQYHLKTYQSVRDRYRRFLPEQPLYPFWIE